MKIDKALEILSEAAFGHAVTFGPDFYDAVRLGIEALHFFKKFQEVTGSHQDARLPSETTE